MDFEDIVICTFNNKWPFSYTVVCLHAACKNLAWPLKPALQLWKKKKKSSVRYTKYVTFCNVFW